MSNTSKFQDNNTPSELENNEMSDWQNGYQTGTRDAKEYADQETKALQEEKEIFAIQFLVDVVIKYGMEYTISGWHQPRGKNPKDYYTNKGLMEFYKRDLKSALNPPPSPVK